MNRHGAHGHMGFIFIVDTWEVLCKLSRSSVLASRLQLRERGVEKTNDNYRSNSERNPLQLHCLLTLQPLDLSTMLRLGWH